MMPTFIAALMEKVMIGCDIMAAAVHLTAARLSGERPDIDYTGTKYVGHAIREGGRCPRGGGVLDRGPGLAPLQHASCPMGRRDDGCRRSGRRVAGHR